MKRVLVTGANGYIGRYVVKALLDLGAEVIAVDLSHDGIDPRAEIADYNIFEADEKAYESLGKPDVCIHLAWKDGFVHNAPSHMEDLPKHYHFIEQMVSGGLKHLAVMGSMHEVGYTVGAVTENTPANPRSMYGIAKNALRQSLDVLQQTQKFTLQWLRGYYIYGDDKRNNSVFAKLLLKAEEGAATFPFTSGKNKYDFIEVHDLAFEIAIASLQEEITGVINCCSGKPVSLKDKVEEFIAEKGRKIELEYGAFPERVYDSPEIYGDCTKIKAILQESMGNYGQDNDVRIRNLLEKLGG